MMKLLLVLLCPAWAAPASPATPATQGPPPVEIASPPAVVGITPSAKAEALQSKGGLTVSTDLRGSYLAGFPVVVTVRVANTSAATVSFPDLRARPHLVRFAVSGPKGTAERYSTPPAVDPPSTWNLPAGSSEEVLLEIPSSAGFAAGTYSFGVKVLDPAGALVFAARPAELTAPNPVDGTPVWEPTIATKVGGVFPWVNQIGNRFELYLMAFDTKALGRPVAQYPLHNLSERAIPVLSRSRPGDARSRHVYWLSAPNQLSVGRLDLTRFEAGARLYRVPYPKIDLVDRGVTDLKGGLMVPLWVPNPAGVGGALRVWCIGVRGTQTMREVGTYRHKPTTTATAVDSGGNLVLAVAHDDGVDLFRVDPTAAEEIPAIGKRAWRPEGGWTVRRLAFDVLPDQADKPGGLALLSVVTRINGGAATHRALWSDLVGNLLSDSGERPWPFAGEIVDLLPNGYGPFYVLSRAADGWNYGAQGGSAARLPKGADGILWATASNVYLRSFGGPSVVRDIIVGPVQR